MVATPERIGFITHEFRTVEVKDEAIQARYGKDARDSGDEPVETFFDSIDDCAAIAAQRFKLLRRDRRRFRHDIADTLDFSGDLAFTEETPAARVIDDERKADLTSAIVECGIDFGRDRSSLITWGTAPDADLLTINGEAVTIDGETVEMI